MADKIFRDLQKGKHFYYNVGRMNDNIMTMMESSLPPPPPPPPMEKSYASVGIHKVKSQNITPNNIGAFILSQIPGINYVSAESIMAHYDNNFKIFYEALLASNGAILDGQKNENGRRINKNAIENIKRYLLTPTDVPL
jgi:hypothetical protein